MPTEKVSSKGTEVYYINLIPIVGRGLIPLSARPSVASNSTNISFETMTPDQLSAMKKLMDTMNIPIPINNQCWIIQLQL